MRRLDLSLLLCTASCAVTIDEPAPLAAPIVRAPEDGSTVAGPVVRLEVDVDAPVRLVFRSSVDGLLARVEGEGRLAKDVQLSTGLHELTATARADGEEAQARWTVRVDQPPSAPGVVWAPRLVDASTPLAVSLDPLPVDLDGDPVTVRFSWTRDGAPVPDLVGPVVPRGRARRGETWAVTVSTTDGTLDAPDVRAEHTLPDAPPYVRHVRIEPALPAVGDTLRCVPSVAEADGDPVTVTVRWAVDEALVEGDTLDTVALAVDTPILCEATVTDGHTPPIARLSAPVRLAAEPTAPALRLVPATPAPGEDVRCTGGPEGASLRWVVAGVPTDGGPTRPAPAAGEELRCEAWLDGAPVDRARARSTVRPPRGNVLVVVLDDVGVDEVGAYGVGTVPAPTPSLDALAAEGLRFDQAWAMPVCSPTRATIHTGRLAWRTGVGVATDVDGNRDPLPPQEVTLPELLGGAEPAWSTAAIGKWHLGVPDTGGRVDALARGYARYEGQPGNLGGAKHAFDLRTTTYSDFTWTDGVTETRSGGYLTTREVDAALEAVSTLPEPWFVYVALHAAHAPYDIPPAELAPTAPTGLEPAARFDALLEAADTELGRLLDAVADDVTVVVLGDNGTPANAVSGPYPADEAKKSVYEGGVRVPLIVRSPWVATPGGTTNALVHVADLFATLLDLAEVPVPADLATDLDSVSFLPVLLEPDQPSGRRYVITERFSPNGWDRPRDEADRAVRSATHKLVWHLGDGYELYALGTDWQEGADLRPQVDEDPELRAVFDDLKHRLTTAWWQ